MSREIKHTCNKEEDINQIKTDVAVIKTQIQSIHDNIKIIADTRETVEKWKGAISMWNYLFPAGIIISALITLVISRLF